MLSKVTDHSRGRWLEFFESIRAAVVESLLISARNPDSIYVISSDYKAVQLAIPGEDEEMNRFVHEGIKLANIAGARSVGKTFEILSEDPVRCLVMWRIRDWDGQHRAET